MNPLFNQGSYSIFKTTVAVEVYSSKVIKDQGKLICFCHNFQAATHNAHTAAKKYHLSLYLFATQNILGIPIDNIHSVQREVSYENI